MSQGDTTLVHCTEEGTRKHYVTVKVPKDTVAWWNGWYAGEGTRSRNCGGDIGAPLRGKGQVDLDSGLWKHYYTVYGRGMQKGKSTWLIQTCNTARSLGSRLSPSPNAAGLSWGMGGRGLIYLAVGTGPGG